MTTLRFLRNAPQGPQASGVAGYKGFFYHFLDMKTGQRAGDSELSTVDTAILLAGALFVQSYFDRPMPEEVEIRKLVDEIYRRVDWRWAQPNAPAISHGWSPEEGFIEYDWRGYNEAMLVYLLALGSPTHPVGPEAWTEWTSTYDASWRTYFGQQFLNFAPLFGHQYTHVWIDFREIQDAYMRRRGLDYFENSRRATYAQRAYAMTNPAQCKDYGANVWGITASDGPGDLELENASGKRRYRGLLRTRRGRRRDARRLHAGADRGGGIDSLRAGAGDSRRARDARALRGVHLLGFWLPRCLQSLVRLPHSGAQRPLHPGLRLGRRRLSRHRSGRDLRDDRELPKRHGLGRDAQERPPAARTGTRGLHGRMAVGVALRGWPSRQRHTCA